MQPKPHIKHIHIKGYKSLRDTSIDLSEGLNIVIGQNGSGKTNFVHIVELLYNEKVKQRDVISAKMDFYTYYDAVFVQKMNVETMDMETKFDAFSIEITENEFDNKAKKNGTVFYRPKNLEMIRFNLPVENIIFTDYCDIHFYKTNNFYTIFDDPYTDLYTYTGVVLSAVKNKTNFTKEEISVFAKNMDIPPLFKNNLATYSPIKDLKFDTSRVNVLEEEREIEVQNIRYLFFVENKWLQWSQLSDGTKRLFYIISHLTYQKDSIFLIEEPELGIHPHQLHNLMRFIKKEAETKQIIVTTHAPQVLNVLSSEDLNKIIVCEATENGTKMRHLTPQQTKRAQKYMASELSLGDYWLHADLEPQNMLR